MLVQELLYAVTGASACRKSFTPARDIPSLSMAEGVSPDVLPQTFHINASVHAAFDEPNGVLARDAQGAHGPCQQALARTSCLPKSLPSARLQHVAIESTCCASTEPAAGRHCRCRCYVS